MTDEQQPNSDLSIVKDYLDDVEQCLDQVSSCILSMEDGIASNDTIPNVLRLLHSLKGASQMIRLNNSASIFHRLEDLFKLIEQKKIVCEETITNTIFSAIDEIKSIAENIRKTGKIEDGNSFTVIDLLELYISIASKTNPHTESPEFRVDTEENQKPFDPQSYSDPETLHLFINNTKAILEDLENDFVVLEQEPTNKDLLDKIFRAMHTIKGNAYTIPINFMGDLSHILENIFDDLRTHKASLSGDLMDILLEGLDYLVYVNQYLEENKIIKNTPNQIIQKLYAQQKKSPRKTELKIESEDTHEPSMTNESLPEESDKKASKKVSQTLRVDITKIDANMNLLTELIINKIRFEERFTHQIGLFSNLAKTIKQLNEIDLIDAEEISFDKNTFTSQLQDIKHIGKELKTKLSETLDSSNTLTKTIKSISTITNDLQESLLKIRMLPISTIFTKYPRLIRDLKRKLKKEINLVIIGEEIELDKTIMDDINDSLMHIVRNCVDHGIELPDVRKAKNKPVEATIKMAASYEGSQVVIEISDDGSGIDPEKIKQSAIKKGLMSPEQAKTVSQQEAINLIFTPGFSTATEVTDLSGRGVGLDVVKAHIKKLKGALDLTSKVDEGTSFRIKLPLTLRILQALLIKAGDQSFAIPLPFILKTMLIPNSELRHSINNKVINYSGRTVPVILLSSVLGIKNEMIENRDYHHIIIVKNESKFFALLADAVIERKEIVIKNLGDYIQTVQHVTGATILGNGKIILILDIQEIVNTFQTGSYSDLISSAAKPQLSAPSEPKPKELKPKESRVLNPKKTEEKHIKSTENSPAILIVEDSSVVRKIIAKALQLSGYRTFEAEDGIEALKQCKTYHIDLFSVDIMMPRMNGYEFVREIRKMEKYKKTPIIMVSSKDQKIDKQKGIEAGADEYITKPFMEQEIIKIVMKKLG